MRVNELFVCSAPARRRSEEESHLFRQLENKVIGPARPGGATFPNANVLYQRRV